MTLTYRLEKGSALSYAELDQNFKTLEGQIVDLQSQIQSTQMTRLSIRMDGHEIIIEDQHDRTLACINLPIQKFQIRGKWQTNSLYSPFDLVSYAGVAYLCRLEHQSANFEIDKDKFLVFCDPKELFQPEATASSSSTVSSFHIPVYSPSALPKPSIGKFACVIEKNGRQHLFVGLQNEWKLINTQSIKKVKSTSLKVNDADETTPS